MTPAILAIETATEVCSVAIAQEERLTATLSLSRPRAHAENLVPLIQDALRYAALEASALDAVAVSMGPGSYTGLRIGVSTAKGLASALGVRLIGVPSLEALAIAAAAEPEEFVCAAFNARRDEVYAAVYQIRPTGVLVPLAATAALQVEDVPRWLSVPDGARLCLVGEGAPKLQPALEAAGMLHLRVLDSWIGAPSAAWVARLALTRWHEGRFDDVGAFEPFYLKEFVARKSERSVFERLPF